MTPASSKTAALECLRAQTPAARATLEAVIAETPIDVIPDGEGWVFLELDGYRFGRVHVSRLLRVPDNPSAS